MNRTVVLERSGLTSGYPLSVHKTTHIKLMFHFRRYHQYRDPRPHPPRTARALWQDGADQWDERRNEGQMGGKREQGRRAGQLRSRVSHYPGACFRPGRPLAPWLLHTPKGPRPGARAAEESGICKEHRAEWPARRVSPGRTPPNPCVPRPLCCSRQARPREAPQQRLLLANGRATVCRPNPAREASAPGTRDSCFPPGSTEAPG